jgi:hypothetical protein
VSEHVVPLNMAATRRTIRVAAIGPLLVAMAMYTLGVLALTLRIHALTHGLQWYVLDDPYIHASIARNLIHHAAYAVTGSAFTPASSSILWPYLLALAFLITGVHAITPLILSFVSGLAVLFAADRLLAGENITPYPRLSALLLISFCTPAIALTFTGMETLLFVAATLLFLHILLRSRLGSIYLPSLTLAAAFLASIRYEGLFVIATAVLLLAIHRRWTAAIATSLAGAAPVVLFGLYAVLRGASFLPNSLLIKTAQTKGPFWTNFLYGPGHGLFSTFALHGGLTLLFLVNAALAVLLMRRHVSLLQLVSSLIFLGSTLLHCAFSRLGWFWRYESYLIALGICTALIAAHNLLQAHAPNKQRPNASPPEAAARQSLLIPALCVLLAVILVDRILVPLRTVPEAALAIYRQQFQTARFLQSAYPHRTIAVNDVGAVSFFSTVDCLDLFGLATNQVTTLKHLDTPEANLDADAIERLVRERNVPIAVLYEDWFPDLPEAWVKVEGWTIPDTKEPIILGDRQVIFYATSAAEVVPLRKALTAFHPSLPPEVEITHY